MGRLCPDLLCSFSKRLESISAGFELCVENLHRAVVNDNCSHKPSTLLDFFLLPSTMFIQNLMKFMHHRRCIEVVISSVT